MSRLDFQAFHKERQFQWYYERALAACERALRFTPNDSNAQVSKGDALFALHRYDEALVAYQEAVTCKASAKGYFGLGETFLKLQCYDEARAFYERAIMHDFSFVPVYESMKEVYQLLHREQEAQKILELMKQQGYEEVES
jgi:tetratricopeptide (TPR) repeat protein